MKKETIYASLQLDSLLRVYTWEERITCHELIIGKQVTAKTKNIERVCRWIEENAWFAPQMMYKTNEAEEMKLYFRENGVEAPIEDYKIYYKEVTKSLTKIRIINK